jgi:hypothetical protein
MFPVRYGLHLAHRVHCVFRAVLTVNSVENRELGTDFSVHKRIILAVNRGRVY